MHYRSQVVAGIIDSYLTRRKSHWGEQPNEDKIKVCKDILESLPSDTDAKNSREWIKFVYILAEKEREQKKERQSQESRPLGTHLFSAFYRVKDMFGGDPLLLATIHAIRSYVVCDLAAVAPGTVENEKSDLVQEQTKYTRERDEFIKNNDQASADEKQKLLDAVNNKYSALQGALAKKGQKTVHEVYFDNEISKDKRTGLEEHNFDDFRNNINAKTRKTEEADKYVPDRVRENRVRSGISAHTIYGEDTAAADSVYNTRHRRRG